MKDVKDVKTVKKEGAAAKERRFVIRAGMFVALAMVLAGFVILVIGKERRLFDKKLEYVGAFENVDGLELDSPVQLGGLEVGRVSGISFSPDLGDKRIRVKVEVAEKFGSRIRTDSVARITSRGVLGDKAVDISLGSPEAPELKNGGELQTGSSGDISSLLKASGEIVDNSVAITRDLRQAVAAYTDPALRDDVAALVKSARNVMTEVEKGDGVLHAVVYDEQTTKDLQSMIRSTARTAARVDGAVTQVEEILKEVRQGDGTLHALLYEKQGALALTELGNAAGELAALVHDAKEQKTGAVYQLVYGDSKEMLADLGAAAADIKAITGKIKSGEGSLGGIINDPTVYEDLKTVLGNVKRNRILRSLVRYSIESGDEIEAAGKVGDGK